jgi:hypothetical protein
MNISKLQLRNQCWNLPKNHGKLFRDAVEKSDHVDYALLRALTSRETNMENIVGDGGHGRGYHQIDDRSHAEWLRKVKAGRGCPPVGEAAKYAVNLIEFNVKQAISAGIPEGHRLEVAIAGYNCGMGNALDGYRHHNDPDHHTAHGNYSKDVLERAKVIREAGWK